jgi:hypothetical protein
MLEGVFSHLLCNIIEDEVGFIVIPGFYAKTKYSSYA